MPKKSFLLLGLLAAIPALSHAQGYVQGSINYSTSSTSYGLTTGPGTTTVSAPNPTGADYATSTTVINPFGVIGGSASAYPTTGLASAYASEQTAGTINLFNSNANASGQISLNFDLHGMFNQIGYIGFGDSSINVSISVVQGTSILYNGYLSMASPATNTAAYLYGFTAHDLSPFVQQQGTNYLVDAPLTTTSFSPLNATDPLVVSYSFSQIVNTTPATGPIGVDFNDTFSLAQQGNVVNLPAGWDASSSSFNILHDQVVPEPATYVVIAVGLSGILLRRRK